MIDAAGNVHHPHQGVARIVSLVPSLTELLFDLGLGSSVVGRTGFCIHPHDAVRRVAKVGGTKDVKLDRVRALRPTHVLLNIDENRREDAQALVASGINVVVTHPLEPRDNFGLYQLLGHIFAVEAAAQTLASKLQQALQRVQFDTTAEPPIDVLYLIWRRPWMTISADTYIARMLALANLRAVSPALEARYPELADTDPLWQQAHAVLLSSEPFPFHDKHVKEFQHFACGHVELVDGELLSWYGSRAIAGVDYIARLGSILRARLNR